MRIAVFLLGAWLPMPGIWAQVQGQEDVAEPLVIRTDQPERCRLSAHHNGPWSPDPRGHTFSLSVAHVWDKPASGRLHYSFETPGHDAVILTGPGRRLPADYVWALWPVYGDGKGHAMFLDGSDGAGEHHYIPSTQGPEVTWQGWKVLWFDLSPRENLSSWGGDGNHVLDPPVAISGLLLDDKPDTFQGESDLYFGDILLITEAMRPRYEGLEPPWLEALPLGAADPRVTACPELSAAPHPDGKLGDPAWDEAAQVGFVTGDGGTPRRATRAWIGRREGVLYLAFECEQPQAAALKAQHTHRDAPVYEDECVEVFLAPKPGAAHYAHLAVNSAGAQMDEMTGPAGRGWNAQWRAAAGTGEGAWYVEMAVPLAAVGVAEEPGAALGLNLGRENHLEPEITAWNPTGDSFHQPDRFGELVLADEPVYPTALSLPELAPAGGRCVAQVRNGSRAAVRVRLAVRMQTAERLGLGQGEQVEIGPGQTAAVEAAFEVPGEGPGAVTVSLADDAGRPLYVSRAYPVTVAPVGERLAAATARLEEMRRQLTGLKLSDPAESAMAARLSELARYVEEFGVRRNAPESRYAGAWARLAQDIAAALDRPLDRAAMSLEVYKTSGQEALTMPPLDYVLGRADTMQKVFRDEPWEGGTARKLTLEAARNEVEGVQLVVAPVGERDVRFATLEISDLQNDTGGTISSANVEWFVVGYVETEKPNYPTPKVGWWPDPLLRQQYFHVPADRVQPIWINVRVPANAKAGLYRGTVTVRPAAQHEARIPLEVRVWNFAVPRQQHLETCFPLRPSSLQSFYRLPEVPIELYEEWMDFCLDHRISINLCDWGNYEADLERLVRRQLGRGGSCFCLGYANFTAGEPDRRKAHNEQVVARFMALYDRVRQQEGWLRRAYVYCHDEIGQEQFEYARELYGALKQAMPDLRLMQTFYKDDPMSVLDDVVDIWAPNTGRYRAAEMQAQQAAGDQVWWYVCCGPGKPFANLMIEWPAVDHRIWPWQTWKMGVTGLLYWGLAVWRDNLAGVARWPEVPWNPATWRNEAGAAHNGDGQLLYPGPDLRPLSSVRFENLRDGIEDYEYLWLLRDLVGRLKKAGGQHKALVDRAEKALAIDDAVVTDLTHFTQDPAQVRKARAAVAGLIERARQVVGD